MISCSSCLRVLKLCNLAHIFVEDTPKNVVGKKSLINTEKHHKKSDGKYKRQRVKRKRRSTMGSCWAKLDHFDCCQNSMRLFGARQPPFERLNNNQRPQIPGSRRGRYHLSTGDTTESQLRHEFVNYPFLKDPELARWIVQARFMFILRGPPGSGKSYITSCIKTRFPTTHVCSADNCGLANANCRFWYQLDSDLRESSLKICEDEATDYASRGASPLVIDNTNMRAYEVRRYTEIARNFDYNVILVTPRTPWRFDANALSEKCAHRVSAEAIRTIISQYEEVYPLYYGWCWAGARSCNPISEGSRKLRSRIYPTWETETMIHEAHSAFLSVLEVPNARRQLALARGLDPNISPDELARQWNSAVNPVFGQPQPIGLPAKPTRPHCTGEFSSFGQAPGAQEYAGRSAVQQALLGAIQAISVLGIFITKRTIGLRLQLTSPDQLALWSTDDNAAVDGRVPAEPRPVGSRAHATLALAPGVLAVQTGLDMLRIVDAEIAGRPDASQVPMPGGALLREILVPSKTEELEEKYEHIFYLQFAHHKTPRLPFAAFY